MFDPRKLLSMAWVYRSFQRSVSKGRHRGDRLVDEFLRIRPGDRILDIGCGPAALRARLPEDIDYHGFDIEPTYIAAAQARYGGRGTFRVQAVAPDAVEGIGQFDVVIAIGVLHHLADDEVRTLLSGAAKVMKPGGRLVTLDGAFEAGQNPIAKLLLRMDRGSFVRNTEDYVRLAREHFLEVEQSVIHDLLSVPYTHLIMTAMLPRPTRSY